MDFLSYEVTPHPDYLEQGPLHPEAPVFNDGE